MFSLLPDVVVQFVDGHGKPLVGGLIYTYESSTTTLKPTFADPEGNAPNTNPIVLDAAGRAKIYLDTGAYRVRILSRDGVLITDTNQVSRFVNNVELAEVLKTVNDGLEDLKHVEESLVSLIDDKFRDEKGLPNGIASLDENGQIPNEQLNISNATETMVGLSRIATQEEANLGSNDEFIITPKKLLSALKKYLTVTDSAPMFACRAWANFNGSNGTLRASGNIKSITNESQGTYLVEFLIPLQDENYAVVALGSARNDATALAPINATLTTTGFKIQANFGGDNTTGTYQPLICSFAVFR